MSFTRFYETRDVYNDPARHEARKRFGLAGVTEVRELFMGASVQQEVTSIDTSGKEHTKQLPRQLVGIFRVITDGAPDRLHIIEADTSLKEGLAITQRLHDPVRDYDKYGILRTYGAHGEVVEASALIGCLGTVGLERLDIESAYKEHCAYAAFSLILEQTASPSEQTAIPGALLAGAYV